MNRSVVLDPKNIAQLQVGAKISNSENFEKLTPNNFFREIQWSGLHMSRSSDTGSAHVEPEILGSIEFSEKKKLLRGTFSKFLEFDIFVPTWSCAMFLGSRTTYCSRSVHFWGFFCNCCRLGVPPRLGELAKKPRFFDCFLKKHRIFFKNLVFFSKNIEFSSKLQYFCSFDFFRKLASLFLVSRTTYCTRSVHFRGVWDHGSHWGCSRR